MTNGLHCSLEEVTDREQVNKQIAQIIVEQFGMQSTLIGVAQGAIDRVARVHHDHYMQVIIYYYNYIDVCSWNLYPLTHIRNIWIEMICGLCWWNICKIFFVIIEVCMSQMILIKPKY